MQIFETIALVLAGCGAFLIGFKLLSENMEKLFGNSLKSLFNKTSEKRLVGVGMGAATTAVIQSSGVTTVMVVGFVNAGIMSLYQAAAIIMGANIGTTITAQIAALNDLPINSIFILLLGVGVFMDLFSKKEKVKSGGLALAGLGMVFLGLHVMSDTMGVYADVTKYPEVGQFLSSLTNPFLLLVFGIVFTTIMQSSSAVTTIIIAMASSGLVIGMVDGVMTNAVLYVILGSNIGSTTTALLSSAGSSTNARRASMIHLLFNTIGSMIFMVMLLIWEDFFQTTFCTWFAEPSTQIAMFHTLFNVTCTLLFLPFTKLLVKASMLLVPDKKENKQTSELVFMDKRLLNTPTVAIGQLTKEVFRMSDIAMQSLNEAIAGFIARDMSISEKIAEYSDKVSRLDKEISDYLVQVSANGISLADEKVVSALHSTLGDVSRIADLADNFTKYTRREVRDNLVFSEGINEKILEMHELLQNQ
ncbi:MAG: Na/Pi cotransporter family protein, partial [Clostridia bacterium]|nr:Na/Pi cotransporter family protein [Clostridia bacterium]